MSDKCNEIDLQKISDELTDGFAKLEHDRQYPTPDCNTTATNLEAWRNAYRNDAHLHNKVSSIVSGVMSIITRNLK